MASTSSGPPGIARPKSSPPPQPKIFSPTPSLAHKSWFSLLASPCPSPANFVPPTSAFVVPTTATPAGLEPFTSSQAQSHNLVDNTTLTNIAQTATAAVSYADPWTRAHVRACAHATDDCAACSIALICCSCRALRYTPGLPPSSPMASCPTPPVQRSQSASPALFRNVGNGSPPPGFDTCDDYPPYDDAALAKALAECDTCDNSSCPRGHDAPATYSIIVEQFNEGTEEFYDRTFRACSACNRSCKKNFLGYRIKSRVFDNSTRIASGVSSTHTTRETPNAIHTSDDTSSGPPPESLTPTTSRPATPLEVFSVVARSHRISCHHAFDRCSTCSRGIVCCECNNLHTAPARLRLRCINCSHYACVTCTTPFCCSCRKPWFPGDSPTIVLTNRFRGGARSTKSSKKGSSSSSQSSGPGSLASARSQQPSPDPFAATPVPILPTQSSVDEIDAFTDKTIRISDTITHQPAAAISDAITRQPTAAPNPGPGPDRSCAPSPSTNLPLGPEPVFSRPTLPVVIGATEDVRTAVPSRAPSRAASIASVASVGDAGIAELLQIDPFPLPSDPPALADVIGRIHKRFPLAALKVDDEDPRHFLARDNIRADEIANDIDHLLSPDTTWASLFFFIRDAFKFDTIQGPVTDFHAFLNGLGDI
ncbi:hypothetical protein AX14_006831, partial [Amanita brunnescens Koide BX004]